jgi:hypothetical protein
VDARPKLLLLEERRRIVTACHVIVAAELAPLTENNPLDLPGAFSLSQLHLSLSTGSTQKAKIEWYWAGQAEA